MLYFCFIETNIRLYESSCYIYHILVIPETSFLFKQHREYEQIFTTLQRRPQPINIRTEVVHEDVDMLQPVLGPRRSHSHSLLHVGSN